MAVEHFFPSLDELERLGHQQLCSTLHEDMGCDVWRRVFGGEDLDWLPTRPWGE